MSGLTNYGADQVLAGNGLPQTLHIKLHTGNPGANGTAMPSATTARAEIDLEPGPDDLVVNDADAVWAGTVSNETATHWSAWDADSGGNPWVVGSWAPVVELTAAGTTTIPAGYIRIGMERHS